MNTTTSPAPLNTRQHTPVPLAVAEHIMALSAAALQVEQAGPASFVKLPPGYDLREVTAAVEKAQPAPNRRSGTVRAKDVESLLLYCADQAAQAAGYIYADPDARKITAVFNDQRASTGWRDHRVEFHAEFTPEFQRWLNNSGSSKAMGQSDFAEFIEDNLADITEPAAHQLLEVATTIQATSGINFASAKRLQDGQTQLTYSETIEARAGAQGALQIPKEFALGLRIFKNGAGYKLRARLKYRLGGGSVKFWYELDRPERAIEDAFAGYVEQVREKSGYAVLLASAG